jgi:hypothetical protein
VAGPLLQPDLKGTYPTRGGEFKLDLKTVTKPTGERKPDKDSKSGLSRTIRFRADEKAPDTDCLKLLQVIRTEDLQTKDEYVWESTQADKNKMITSAGLGVQPGFFVDHDPARFDPRRRPTDDPVSPYYIDSWQKKVPSGKRGVNQIGSKKGETISDAVLWDQPGAWGHNVRFSFETVAIAADSGHVYGTVDWGFTLKDYIKGEVVDERAVGRNVTLRSTGEAVRKFHEFYRNPGSPTAPKGSKAAGGAGCRATPK